MPSRQNGLIGEGCVTAPGRPAGPGATPMRAIVLLAFAGLVSAANLRICDPLLPQIAGELGVTIGAAGTIVTAFALSYGLFQVVVGPLGDAQGKVRLIVAGCFWAGSATMVCAASSNLAGLTVLR